MYSLVVEHALLEALGRNVSNLRLDLRSLFGSGAGERVGPAAVARRTLDRSEGLTRSLNNLEVGRREVAGTAITRAALPPLARVANGIALGENSDQIALAHFHIDVLDGVAGLRSVVVQQAAVIKLGRVQGLLRAGQSHAATFFLLRRCCHGVDHLAHQVRETESGKEEEEERLAGSLGGSQGSTVRADGRTAFEFGKGCWCERGRVGWGWAAGDLGDEGADPTHQGEDAEYRAQGIPKIAELLCYRHHRCDIC